MFLNSRSRTQQPRRKTPRQQRSRATVQTILAAAAQVLEQRGHAGFNTNRVAQRAGVSIGSVYQYFASKQALLAALGSANVDATERALLCELATLRASDAGPAIVARRIIAVWCDTHDDAQHALIYAVHSTLPELRQRGELALTRVSAEIGKHLRALGIGKPMLRARAVVLTALVLVHELVISTPRGPRRRAAQREASAMLEAYLERCVRAPRGAPMRSPPGYTSRGIPECRIRQPDASLRLTFPRLGPSKRASRLGELLGNFANI